jgi:hypothetical protein
MSSNEHASRSSALLRAMRAAALVVGLAGLTAACASNGDADVSAARGILADLSVLAGQTEAYGAFQASADADHGSGQRGRRKRRKRSRGQQTESTGAPGTAQSAPANLIPARDRVERAAKDLSTGGTRDWIPPIHLTSGR